jgi:hypothetical protein
LKHLNGKENEQSSIKALPWKSSRSNFDSASAIGKSPFAKVYKLFFFLLLYMLSNEETSSRSRRDSTDVTSSLSMKKSVKRPSSAKATTQSFYINGKTNVKGTVFEKFPTKKSVRKEIRFAAIPDYEEIITTKDVRHI